MAKPLIKNKKTEKRFKACLPWSNADVERLIELYPKTHNRELAIMFGRAENAVRGKARGLRLQKDYAGGYQRLKPVSVAWTEDEISLLQELYPIIPNEEASEIIGHSFHGIQKKAEKLRLRKLAIWSEEENECLKTHYKNMSYEELAERLGRTSRSVEIRVITLGLASKVEKWAENEVNSLKQLYPKTDTREIAKIMGRTCVAIHIKARKLRISKDCQKISERLAID